MIGTRPRSHREVSRAVEGNGVPSIRFFFQAEDCIRDGHVTGVQTCALPIFPAVGKGIDQETFDQLDYARFQQRLEQCLSTLGRLLQRPGFVVRPATLGAELELFVVDDAAKRLRNRAVRAAAADPRVNLELDRFNLELNATPTPLASRPFAVLRKELRLLLEHVAVAARAHGGRLALIGILPTLGDADLHPGVVSDVPRYRALNSGLQRLRNDPFDLRIAGAEPDRKST